MLKSGFFTKQGPFRDYYTDELDTEKMWQHLNRMQKRIMAKPYITKAEFLAQPESDQIEFYSWIQKQCGSNACFM